MVFSCKMHRDGRKGNGRQTRTNASLFAAEIYTNRKEEQAYGAENDSLK